MDKWHYSARMGQCKKDIAIGIVLIAVLGGLAGAWWLGVELSVRGEGSDQRLSEVTSNHPAELTNATPTASNAAASPTPGNATNASASKRATPGKRGTPMFYGK